MKVLLIDYMAGYGHRSFNRIHINAISQNGPQLYLLSKKGFFDYYNDDNIERLSIPTPLFKSFKAGILAQIFVRLLDILKLIYVKWIILRYKPDKLIFLDYDIMSFFPFRTKKEVALINHFNVDDLNNPTKLFLTKLLPQHYVFINLNEYIDKRQHELMPKVRTVVIPHGLDNCPLTNDRSLLSDISLEKYIFCPISSSFSRELLKDVLSSMEVKKYLTDNNMKICLKGELTDIEKDENIVNLPKFIDSKLYSSIMINSYVVFLPYNSSFRYRVSGVLHECFANNIPVICNDTESFRQYSRFINYKALISNSRDFVTSLESLKRCNKYYRDLDQLSPVSGWKQYLTGGSYE